MVAAVEIWNSSKQAHIFSHHNASEYDKPVQLAYAELVALSFYIGIVGFLGLIGNILVVAAFYRYRSLRTSTNTFILHLGLCNLILAAMDLCFSLPSTVSRRWLYGLHACRFYGLTYQFFCYVSLNTLAIISLDRYWVITKPSIGIKITIRRAVLCIAICYVYTSVFSIPLFLQWMEFREEAFYTGCYLTFSALTLQSLLYSIIHGVFLFLVPFAIMIFCYGSIFKSVKRKGRYGVRLRSIKGNNKWSFTIQRIPHWRTARMIIVVIFVFLACWLPYVIVSMCKSFGRGHNISSLTLEITLLVAKSGVIYNPFIYAALNLRFRTAFFEMLKCDRFFDRSKWGIKSRVLTMSTGDSSGQHPSRTGASNCTSSRALVTRSASYIRSCEHCSSSIDNANRGEQLGSPAQQRPHSFHCEGRWLQTKEHGVNDSSGNEFDGEIRQERNFPHLGCACNHTMSSRKLDVLKSPRRNKAASKGEEDSKSNSDRGEPQNLIRTLRIVKKETVDDRKSSSAGVEEDLVVNCPCQEIWKSRTPKCKKKRFSSNTKDESKFSCTCGPNVKLCDTPQETNGKDAGSTHAKSSKRTNQQGATRDVYTGSNGIHLSQELKICQRCMKNVPKESGKTDDRKNGEINDAKVKRYSYHFSRRSSSQVLEIKQGMGYCTCQKQEERRFGSKESILKRKLKNRRTSENVHTGMPSTQNESFWRRPSLVLANNVYPISFTPQDI